MSIASEITRLQGVKSDILQAIADKGVTIPTGSALADCPTLIASITGGGGGGFPGTTIIGGRTYKTTKIGNQTWLAENLDYKFPGLVVGGDQSWTELRGNYYSNNENTYGMNGKNYGLLYNGPAVEYLESHKTDLIPGWRVPNDNDFYELKSYINNDNNDGLLLSADSPFWGSRPGLDFYKFSFLPAGDREQGTFYYDEVNAMLMSLTKYASDAHVLWLTTIHANKFVRQAAYGQDNRQFSVRLIKD